MYYEERMINGILHWRGTPDGVWHVVSNAQRREGMLRDVMEMANRARTAAVVASLDRKGKQRIKLKRHERNCRRFISELVGDLL